jgi:hypothetical protein
MHERKRWRMRVDDFALARGATDAVTVKQTAEKLWEPKFLAEIIGDAIRAYRRTYRGLRLV